MSTICFVQNTEYIQQLPLQLYSQQWVLGGGISWTRVHFLKSVLQLCITNFRGAVTAS